MKKDKSEGKFKCLRYSAYSWEEDFYVVVFAIRGCSQLVMVLDVIVLHLKRSSAIVLYSVEYRLP